MTSLVVAALAVVAAACQSDGAMSPRAIEPTLAATSGGVEQNDKIPVTLFVFVPCANGGAGEVISVSGDLHVIYNILADGVGGIHLKTHAQPQGLSGTGLTTGDKYQAVGVTQDNRNIKTGSTFTFVNNFRMIGQGPGNNYQVHQNIHVTINANGDITSNHDNTSITCK